MAAVLHEHGGNVEATINALLEMGLDSTGGTSPATAAAIAAATDTDAHDAVKKKRQKRGGMT